MVFWLNISLALLFLVHWVVFTRLALLRQQLYYWLLCLLFLLLTLSFTLKALNPGLELAGWPVHLLMRYMAWMLAGVTIPLLIIRLKRRQMDRAKITRTKP
ncbi:MAG: hypothetical protein ACI9MF_001081 [Gammaproteobacteria bacterium]|jgi:hypothetical protein